MGRIKGHWPGRRRARAVGAPSSRCATNHVTLSLTPATILTLTLIGVETLQATCAAAQAGKIPQSCRTYTASKPVHVCTAEVPEADPAHAAARPKARTWKNKIVKQEKGSKGCYESKRSRQRWSPGAQGPLDGANAGTRGSIMTLTLATSLCRETLVSVSVSALARS